MYVIGLDIGGANIKSADCNGVAHASSFELWKTPELLKQKLQEILTLYQQPDLVAVTMTGELADCFQSKAEGVETLLSATEQAVAPVPVVVWQTGAEFLTTAHAREFPFLAAAANWHALATWLGRMIPEQSGVLIDIGSTTTDIIPIQEGVPVPEGLTDVERLLSGELVYTGGRRTPVAMIERSVPLHGQPCPMAAECFATALDLYLLLEDIDENESDTETANGRPATRFDAYDRISRSVCCDISEITRPEAVAMATFLAKRQQQQISEAVDQVLGRMTEPPSTVLVSGSAVFLAEKVVESHPILSQASLTNVAKIFDGSIADSACAFAVARLGAERVRF
ncbi:MAG: H4MPT-linked C1 transfer pathway protein [Planctomycetes bacterium]|nr:H4MPT-linked C1 transfer pathway protein [Planctomycetota bacterium]MCH9727865.1 H4MPT-linked C1 transfer pathway protein [Planctomycetota bacterium]MCH9775467.1 H4MPT-linked C1 transfer pathway protein [Planctomycetota bacterium]MCH9793133.1 H4MPT-linked C1 transfer pathway protein [Planctomycetota bacterium]